MICIITTPKHTTRNTHMHTITRFHTHAQGHIGWLALRGELTVGHIFMQEEPGERIKFLDAWTHPDYRREGIFRTLWDTRWRYVTQRYPGHTVYAWCLPGTLPHLLNEGFQQMDTAVRVERKISSTPDSPIGPCTAVTC